MSTSVIEAGQASSSPIMSDLIITMDEVVKSVDLYIAEAKAAISAKVMKDGRVDRAVFDALFICSPFSLAHLLARL